MNYGLTQAAINANTVAQSINAHIAANHDDQDRQTLFFATLAIATEHAVLMETENPGIFDEYGGVEAWAKAMLDNALREMGHAIAIRGKPQN